MAGHRIVVIPPMRWRRSGAHVRRLARLGFLLLLLGLPVAAGFSLLSAIDYTILRQVPYPHADRLYQVRQHHPAYAGGGAGFAPAQIEDLRRSLRSADLVTGVQFGTASIRIGAFKERVPRAIVARDYLEMIGAAGVGPRRTAEGDTDRREVYLSHRFWLRRCAGDATIVGTEMLVDDVAHIVAGILPPVPLYPAKVDLLLLDEAFPELRTDRRNYGTAVLLRRTVPEDRLRSDLRRVAPLLAEAIIRPGNRAEYRLEATPLRRELAGTSASVLVPLEANASALLILGAFNAWCVWYLTALSRRTEIQIRLALGASRRRLMIGFVAEALVMSLLVIGAGIYLGTQALPLLRAFLSTFSERHEEIAASARAATLTFATAGALAAVAAPLAWGAATSSRAVDPTPRQRGFGLSRRQRTLQRLVIGVQTAVSFVLLLAGLSAVAKLQALESVGLGFEPRQVITAEVELPSPRYDEPEEVIGFVERVQHRLDEVLPRHQIAVATSAPLAGDFLYAWILRLEAAETDGVEQAFIETRAVSEAYFETLGATFLEGRPFDERDRLRGSVIPVVVNEALVSQYWGSGRDRLGRRLFAKDREFSVVGVIRDMREKSLSQATPAVLYIPYWILPHPRLTLLAGLLGAESERAMAVLRATVLAEEPEAVAVAVSSMSRRFEGLLRPDRLTAHLLSGLAAIAFVLFFAGVGALVFLESASRELEHVIRLVFGSSRAKIAVRLGVSLSLTMVCGLAAGAAIFHALASRGAAISFGSLSASTATLGALALVTVAPIAAGLATMKLPLRDLSSVLRRE